MADRWVAGNKFRRLTPLKIHRPTVSGDEVMSLHTNKAGQVVKEEPQL